MAGALAAARSRAGFAAAAVITAVVLAVPVAGAFRSPGAPMEEGKLLAAGELVLAGRVPHADFEHFYGPADVWAVAVAFATFGHKLSAERALGVLYLVVLVASVFALASRAGRVPAVGAAVMSGLLLVPFGVHAYSWTAGLAFLTLAVALAVGATEREGRRLALASGAAAGLALLFRADLVVAAVLVTAVCWKRLAPRQRTAGLAGVLVVGGIPYLVHVATAGVGNVWRGMVVDTLFRLRAGRALPMPPPTDELAGYLDRVAPEPLPSSLFPDPSRVVQLHVFFWLTLAAVLATVACAVLVRIKRGGDLAASTWLACVAALGVGTVSQMLQRADATHVRIVACVIVPLACVAIGVTLAAFDARLPRSAIATEALFLVGLVLVLGVPFYAARLALDTSRAALRSDDVADAGSGDRRFPVAASAAPQVNELLLRLRDTAGRRVFVGPKDLRLANYSDAFVYFLAGDRFRPASFYLESNPGLANADDSDLAEDLRTADVLVLTDIYDRWDEPNTSRRQGPPAAQVVADTEFCTTATLERYEIRVRC